MYSALGNLTLYTCGGRDMLATVKKEEDETEKTTHRTVQKRDINEKITPSVDGTVPMDEETYSE